MENTSLKPPPLLKRVLRPVYHALNHRCPWLIVLAARLVEPYFDRRLSSVVIENVRVPLHKSISPYLKCAIFFGGYEKQELAAINACIEPTDTVLELGTGIGLTSALCALKIGGDRVYTFEANPELRQIIEETYALNAVQPRLTIGIAGERSGETQFYIDKDFWNSSIIPIAGARMVSVPVFSFENELQKIGPSMLIIDIEGGEYELLMSTELKGVRKLIIEIHDNVLGEGKTKELVSCIEKQGFKVSHEHSSSGTFLYTR
jgi:FkbM family methyltransferase